MIPSPNPRERQLRLALGSAETDLPPEKKREGTMLLLLVLSQEAAQQRVRVQILTKGLSATGLSLIYLMQLLRTVTR